LTILTTATIIGMVTSNVQQASAPRNCGACVQFKKLTHEFERDVIEAATIGDPGLISGLLEQYNEDVRALDLTR
ncbi:MAG TPA: hypothetical protein VF220_01855, partial [Nitrososphaeraceae archaeon]